MAAYLKKYNLAKTMRGFTLIELLIVMAILGVLAVVVLVAINPAEQMARARDSGRVSGVQQLGRAVTAYYTAMGAYPLAGSWSTDIVTSQDISRFPSNPGSTDPACAGATNGFCYATAASGTAEYAVVYAQLVSQQNTARCAGATPYAVFSSFSGRGGIASAVPTATAEPAWCN